MKRWVTISFLLLLICLTAPDTFAQGVTTATIRGEVIDDNGEPLPGANVVAIHEPSGSQYGTTTNTEGRYTLPNVRVGGPYAVTASFVGYQTTRETGVTLRLGAARQINFELATATEEMEGVEVVATRSGIFDAERTGQSTNISEDDINRMPSVGRDLADFARLTPQAVVGNDDDDGASISIAGQNNRYNSIYIDGAVSNDVFGLSAQGTNGGQTGSTPISIDAIEQFQVNTSPYDVSQSGFTGGAINAVTRSGTNEFEGSAYYFVRDEKLAGRTPLPNTATTEGDLLSNFSNNRYGFRLGGPIVKNKLFFFVNGEVLRSQTPQPYTQTYQGESADRIEELRQALIDEAGYDPGAFGNLVSQLDSDKLLVKLDWNINSSHKLTLRNNYVQSDNVDAFGSDNNTVNFGNTAEVFPNTTNTTVLELNSAIGNQFANSFTGSYTVVRDDRGYRGDPFPGVRINDGSGSTIFIGPEAYSTANRLDQNILTLKNEFSWFRGDHTFELGANFEYYDMMNVFIPQNFGVYNYASMDDFLSSLRGNPVAPEYVNRGYSLADDDPSTPEFEEVVGDGSNAASDFSAAQFGVWLRDQYQVNDRMRLDAGVRVDVPMLLTDPSLPQDAHDLASDAVNASGQHYALNGAAPGETYDTQILFSPRLGFNYDVFGDRSTQLRGGLGAFTGRVPFVWAGSIYINNGANNGQLPFNNGRLPNGDPIPFVTNPIDGDPINGADFLADGQNVRDNLLPSGRLELFESDFTFPRVFRTNLGVDQQLPFGVIATLEGQYTNTLSNIKVTNINLRSNEATLQQLAGPDNRTIYAAAFDDDPNDEGLYELDVQENLVNPQFSAIHRIGDTSEGYTYDITARLQKTFADEEIPFFDEAHTSVSYTYGDAYSVNDGTSSQVNSLWQYTESVNGPNDVELARSDFSTGNRIIGSFSLERSGTRVSAFLTMESGRPFSYTIDTDNADLVGAGAGDSQALFYVPEDASDLTFIGTPEEQAEQAAALDAFIDNNEYLSSRRGQYAERNGDRTPFETALDLSISQEVFGDLSGLGTLEITLDIFNFTNLLNPDWGRRYSGIFGYNVVNFEGFAASGSGEPTLTPVYSFDNRASDSSYITSKDQIFQEEIIQSGTTYSSRWQMKLGARLTF